MQHSRQEKLEAFGRVMDTLDRLRKECPWDRKQTNDSLRPNTIEETYELCEALLNDDNENIKKELQQDWWEGWSCGIVKPTCPDKRPINLRIITTAEVLLKEWWVSSGGSCLMMTSFQNIWL